MITKQYTKENELENHYLIIEIDSSNYLKSIKEENQCDNSTHILAYGYVDHEAGTSINFEAFCTYSADSFSIDKTFEELGKRSMLRYDMVSSFDLEIVEDNELEKYNLPKYPTWLESYRREDLELFRQRTDILHLKTQGYTDDLQVYLLPKNEATQPELIWCRIEKTNINNNQDILVGTLLNKPHQNFGTGMGEPIIIMLKKQEDQYIAISHQSLKEAQG